MHEIIEDRSALEVRWISADRTKVRPPGHEADLLPRYHRLVLGVRKHRASRLCKLTVTVLRSGSAIGSQNVEYATIDLPAFAVGTEISCDIDVFDPFNLPFQPIEVVHNPGIGLSSKIRVRFEEIKDFLLTLRHSEFMPPGSVKRSALWHG